jgi:hypothetical protein
MLKKCTGVMSAFPSKLHLTQKIFTTPLAYRFGLSAENTSKLNLVANRSIEEEVLNLKKLSFSTFKIDEKVKDGDILVEKSEKRF